MAGLAIKIVNPLECSSWDQLLLSHPGYSFFHSSRWAEVLLEAYNYKPSYFTVAGNNRLSALLPVMEINSPLTGKRGVSLPFTDYCAPLFTEDFESGKIFDCLVEHGAVAGWKFVEIRGACDLFKDQPESSYSYGHILELSNSEEAIFSRFRDSTKRNIKKALKEGVDVRFETSPGAVKEFYRLNCVTRRQHGLPPQPYGFFKSLHKNVISRDLGFIALAYHKKAVVAGALYVHFGGKAIYKYGASDRSYNLLRANNIIMWEAIKWYAERGYKQFCFGRTEPGNSGLRQFKTGWGTTERTIKYYRYDFCKKAFVQAPLKVSGAHNGIFRKMPAPLLRGAGALMYRHMG
ncbi:MAG: GNAT family N-acetyltransferase [Nitrospiraceae bacterium]|nr:GNAT family N-acetyltransferase [Nitrospiraceae bacterium]